jgi:hypothetical protein
MGHFSGGWGMPAAPSFLKLHRIGTKEGPFALYHEAVAIAGQAHTLLSKAVSSCVLLGAGPANKKGGSKASPLLPMVSLGVSCR